MMTCRFRLGVLIHVNFFVLTTAATVLFAADNFAWDTRKFQVPNETLEQVHLSDRDRTALRAALSSVVGLPLANLSLEDQAPNILVKLIDLNGDRVPEVVARASSTFWCGATGNCSMWVFGKVGAKYEPLVVEDEISSYLGFTAMPQRTGGYLDLVFKQHDSAFRQALIVFKFRNGKYRASDCYQADWTVIGDETAIAKKPRISHCGDQP